MTDSTGRGHGRAAAHGARSLGGSTADRNIVVFGLGLLFCALLIAVLPDLAPAQTGLVSDRAHGRVTALLTTGDNVAPQASVLVLDGLHRGETITAILESPTSQAQIPKYQAGDEVLVAIDLQPDGTITYSVIDRWRAPILLTIVAALALMTIAIAGWRGLRALTSLAITVVVVVRLLIPLLLSGYSPVGLAIGLGILITVLSLLMTQGISRPTFAAIAGTAVGLIVTGVLAVVVSSAAQFTAAQGSEEVAIIAQIAGNTIDLSGLLLAAVIFGGLGVLNDVAITQAVTIDEFRSIDPTMSRRELYRRAMSVGTAHLAATVNTLVFAYLGAALPVIVLLALQIHRLDLAVNDEHIAVEVVRTVVGAIGVLSAVPLTTAIAAWWAGPTGRAGTVPRRIMALPLPVDASLAPVEAAVASKPGRGAMLRRLVPKRRSKEVAPAAVASARPPAAQKTPAADSPAAEKTPAADSPAAEKTSAADAPAAEKTPTAEAPAAEKMSTAIDSPAATERADAADAGIARTDEAPPAAVSAPEPAPPADTPAPSADTPPPPEPSAAKPARKLPAPRSSVGRAPNPAPDPGTTDRSS